MLVRVLIAIAAIATLVAACGDPRSSGRDDDDGWYGSISGSGGMGGAPTTSTTIGTSSTTSTTASTSTTSTGGGPVPGGDDLGFACQSDADCGPLDCIEETSGAIAGGAPQNGLCTKTCSDDTDCPPNGYCVGFGGNTGHCTLKCTYGSATAEQYKCRGRDDVACNFFTTPNNVTIEACSPVCESDAACGSGLHCNYGTGLCQANEPAGDPMGTQCTPNGPKTCAGLCLCNDSSCNDGFCSGLCSFGTTGYGCGGLEGDGWCGLNFDEDYGAGDIGACMALCQCDGDCSPAHVCNQLNGTDQQALDHNGVCYTQITSTTFPICCDCTGKVCGDDGCGTSCGSCGAGEMCTNGASCCTTCGAKECGADGCGGTCGSCAANEICDVQGQCQCVPDCNGKVCGNDGCGGSCGSCPPTEVCDAGACCQPSCSGKECGSDGCGGSCGSCASNEACDAGGQCQCVPSCGGNDCGPDGCGGSCGTCSSNDVCDGGSCCTPNCVGKNCGSDGCGGSCGPCAGSCISGQCCQPQLPCSDDLDCCGELCGLYTSACYVCLPDGEFCTSHGDCCSNACGDTTNQCQNCLNEFDNCLTSSQCCNGKCDQNLGWCNVNCDLGGVACSGHGDCCSGFCQAGFCSNAP